MGKPKVTLQDTRVESEGHLSYNVYVDGKYRGSGDLFCRDAGDLVEDDGLPSVGGSPEVFEDDEISDEVRTLAIRTARMLGMKWPDPIDYGTTYHIVKRGSGFEMVTKLGSDDECVASFEKYRLEEAIQYFEGFQDGWTALRATFQDLLGVGP